MKYEFTNPNQNSISNGNLVVVNNGPFEVTDAEAKVLDELTTVIDGITVPAFQEVVAQAAKLDTKLDTKTKDKEK